MSPSWMEDGRCAGMNPDPWFSDDARSVAYAKSVCARCPVRVRDSFASEQPFDTMGGPGAAQTVPAHSPNLDERSELMQDATRVPITLPESVAHGTNMAYRKHGCRCDECRGLQTELARERTERREGRKVTPRRKPVPVEEWRTLVIENDNGCLVWQGNIDPNGYARLGGQWAHRAVYMHEMGPIPEGHELDHVCVNPPCVNPEHLDPVTRAEHAARTWERLGKNTLHASAAYMRTIGLTYAEIADALGYAGKESAHCAVLAAIDKGLVDPDDLPTFEPLTQADCQDIVDIRAAGVPVSDIVAWYGIDGSTASRISRGFRSGQQEAQAS